GDTLSRGDWFLDPARALAFHARFDGDFSLKYVYNPYLADLGLGDGATILRHLALEVKCAPGMPR
ncbi:MAG: hypothetical protein DRI40_07720, partial [Chloroflexi bacterium]